jgi:TolB protein
VIRLTFSDNDDGTPVFCSDNLILYSSIASGNWDVWSMDSTGNNKTQLTTSGSHEFPADCSPDGSKVAYVSGPSLFTMDIDGSNQTSFGVNARTANWSPNGTHLVLDQGTSDVFKVESDGTNLTKLTNYSPTNVVSAPGWSPDGQNIIFISTDSGSPTIELMDTNGNNWVRLAENFGQGGEARWGP